jgi:hypothetical protein
MTEATCDECMILKRVNVLGELQMTVGTRYRLIRFNSQRQNNGDDHSKRNNGYQYRGHNISH